MHLVESEIADPAAEPSWSDFDEHYGIRVAYLDEDGEMVALGHHDPRRVVAAFNRHSRQGSCWLNMADDTEVTYREVVNALQVTRVTQDFCCGVCADYDDECTACYAAGERGLFGDITVWKPRLVTRSAPRDN